ncbi:MAG TPA: DinB family protein [Candidatus Krumholzibacteria bacterium]|nr:DinB family protein [Candidatus Krumholzibacteria bacterium]
MQRRPESSEYFEYYETYVKQVTGTDIVGALRRQNHESRELLATVSPDRLDFRYAPGKWSLKEVVAHVLDTEWVFASRALHFARAVPGALPGVDQDDMIAAGNVAGRPYAAMLTEWNHLREASALMFASLDDAGWDRTGIASGKLFTVRALAYIIVGHERHHMNVIRERYLREP